MRVPAVALLAALLALVHAPGMLCGAGSPSSHHPPFSPPNMAGQAVPSQSASRERGVRIKSQDDAAAPEPHTPPPRQLLDAVRPKIYVYDLPEKYRTSKFTEMRQPDFPMKSHPYSLDHYLPILIRDSPYVTTNGEEADFFYVPIILYGVDSALQFAAEVLQVGRVTGAAACIAGCKHNAQHACVRVPPDGISITRRQTKNPAHS